MYISLPSALSLTCRRKKNFPEQYKKYYRFLVQNDSTLTQTLLFGGPASSVETITLIVYLLKDLRKLSCQENHENHFQFFYPYYYNRYYLFSYFTFILIIYYLFSLLLLFLVYIYINCMFKLLRMLSSVIKQHTKKLRCCCRNNDGVQLDKTFHSKLLK